MVQYIPHFVQSQPETGHSNLTLCLVRSLPSGSYIMILMLRLSLN